MTAKRERGATQVNLTANRQGANNKSCRLDVDQELLIEHREDAERNRSIADVTLQ